MLRFSTILISCSLLILASCSRNASITTPNVENEGMDILQVNSLPLLVDSFDSERRPSGGSGLLGLFSVSVDTSTLQGEIAPLRISALDDSLEIVDITNFLTLAPCTDCVHLKSIELDLDSNIVLSIGIRHPFPPGNPLDPITGRNRADLHVFNVEGTVVIGDSAGTSSFPLTGETTSSFCLVNADGYSPYLDIALDEIFPTTATVHPYILHFDDYTAGNFEPSFPTGFISVTDPGPSGNLVMRMGSDYDYQNYVFASTPGSSFEFLYAVGCSYAVSSASKSERFNPEFQIPQHNKKAASEVSVEILSNDLDAGNPSSSAEILVKVLDISHDVAVGDGLDQMKAISSVSMVTVEIPGVTGLVNGPTTPSGGNGRDPLNPLTYPITINNELSAGIGTYLGLVKVLDSYPTGLNEAPLLGGMDAIKRVGPIQNPLEGLYQLSEFATYTLFEIEITIQNTPPTAMIMPSSQSVCDGYGTSFDASGSTDAEDDVAMIPLNFEFDFDYDGVNFVSDTGAPSTNPIGYSTPYSAPGPYTAAVRVTDSIGASDIATTSVIIGADLTLASSVIDITDGTTIQGVRYYHTTEDLSSVPQVRDWSHGMEGTAYGNGYIYLTFYTSSGDLYFTRSDDSGLSWDTPVVLAPGVPNLGAASIAAAGSEIFIIYANRTGGVVYLKKNSNSGTGSWDTYTVGSYGSITIANLSVAVDPTDTNYVYASMTRSTTIQTYGVYLLRNSTGGSGTWTEQYCATPNGVNSFNYETMVNSDGKVYVMFIGNYIVGVTRSDDHGVNFTPWGPSSGINYVARTDFVWGVEGDMCFDPSNLNKIFVIWVCIGNVPLPPQNFFKRIVLLRSDNQANNLAIIQETVVSTLDWPSRQPAILKGQNGKLYIVYAYETTPSDFDIFVRTSCDDGATLTPQIQINTDDDGIDADPELVIAPHGGVVLTWDDNGYINYGSDNPSGKIVARRLF